MGKHVGELSPESEHRENMALSRLLFKVSRRVTNGTFVGTSRDRVTAFIDDLAVRAQSESRWWTE